ncbi:MAG: VCBS repeat-containing protein [Lewinellaceae bacterium]|nr:VCBS repeat-containing protein [Lewinellaceae bacterium]
MPSGKVHNYLYQNHGSLCLEDVSEAWGFGGFRFSNGAIYADLDNDGDLDLVANAVASPAAVYENKATTINKNKWLQIKCKGPAGNPAGIGAKVMVTAGGQHYYMEMSPYRGFYSSVEPIFQVGLGEHKNPVTVEVAWPGGGYQRLEQVQPNQRLILDFAQTGEGQLQLPDVGSAVTFAKDGKAPKFRHQENDFEDFDQEKLLPHRFSRQGPCLAVADVNGDGLEDVFAGGARGQQGELFVQSKSGGFSSMPQPAFAADRSFEDTGALWFDADADGDPDLLVVSGGNEMPRDGADYAPRLYRNNGKGQLSRDAQALPAISCSAKAVAALDFDGDGDLDLFIGGAVIPGFFPMGPRSYLLKNDKGIYSDVTAALAPELQNLGMISSVQIADLDGDKRPELVLAGEWMPIQVLQWNGQSYSLATTKFGLENSSGWWNCLQAVDLDGDGDQDLVAGNLGLNTRYKASPEAPLRLFAKDWDANGSIDPLVAIADNGDYVSTIMRDYWVLQIGAGNVKKLFPRHTRYANAAITDMYAPEVLRSGITLDAKMLQSAWFENQNGHFVVHDLPYEAQVAPMYAIVCQDFDQNGLPDLLLLGNDSGLEVETGRQDASNGVLLMQTRKGEFTCIPNRSHKLWANGDVRSAAMPDKQTLWIGNNDGLLQAFSLQ